MERKDKVLMAWLFAGTVLLLASCSQPHFPPKEETFFTPYPDKTLYRDPENGYYSLRTRKIVEQQIVFLEELFPRLAKQSELLNALDSILLVAEGKRGFQDHVPVTFSRANLLHKPLSVSLQQTLSILDNQNERLALLASRVKTVLEQRQTSSLLVTRIDAHPLEQQNKENEIVNFSQQYEEAIRLYYARQYTKAITVFQSLLANGVPESLADNCHFWAGASYFQRGALHSAMSSFVAVMKYPTSDKHESALFMIGQCYERLGQRELAHSTFRLLLERFPQTTLRTVTEQKLIALR